MYKIGKYDTAPFPFPSDEASVEDKISDEYNITFSEAFYSSYVRGLTSFTYSNALKFLELRAFGNGRQPESRYQDMLYPIAIDQKSGEIKRDNQGKAVRKGYMNLNWQIFSPADKIKEKIIGMYSGVNSSLSVTAIDEVSIMEKEEAKWNAWFQKEYGPQVNEIKQIMGMPTDDSQQISVSNKDELEMFQAMGAFKLKREAMIKEGCRGAFYESEWPIIERKLIEDFIDGKIGAVMDYTDPITQRAKCKYLDPAKLFTSYTREYDFKNVTRWGYLEEWTIADLRVATELSEDELRQIANSSLGLYGNALTLNIAQYASNGIPFTGVPGTYPAYYGYDSNICIVLFSENLSIDEKDGVKVKTVYKRRWLVGTKHVFECGQQYDIPRPAEDNQPRLSINAYRISGRSITERSVPIYDSIQLGWLKYQNNKAQAKPKGTAFDTAAMSNITIQKEKMDPRDIMLMYSHSGNMLFSSRTNLSAGISMPNNSKPFYEMEGGIGRALDEWIISYDKDVSILMDYSGLTDSASSGSMDPNMPAATQKLAALASSQILKSIYFGFTNIMQNTSVNLANRITSIIKYNKKSYKSYYNIFGKAGTQVFMISDDVCDAKYGIEIVVAPDDSMKQRIDAAATESMKAGKSGKEGVTGITFGDWLMIQRFIEGDNIDLASAYFMKKEEDRKKAAMEMQQQNMQENGKIAQQTENQKHENAVMFEKMKTDEMIRFEWAKALSKNWAESQMAEQEFSRETGTVLLQYLLNPPAAPAGPAGPQTSLPSTSIPPEGQPMGSAL